jgi:anaerobic selenocysteine-containing dehydrogenase
MQVRKAICNWCKGKCGVHVHIRDDGSLERVEVMTKKEFQGGSYGAGCKSLRYRSGLEWFSAPHRLRHPLRRAGGRGENRWERIGWDEALDAIAGRLAAIREAHGAHAVVASAGDTWTHEEYKQRFLSLFGTPNVFGAGPICFGPRSLVSEAIVGWYPAFSLRPTTRSILCLGVQPKIARPANWITIQKAKQQGAKLITLDPRATEVAKLSDVWVQLRPGTDAAVLLGMIHHIIEHDLYDRDFVERWCHGFEALRARAAEYPLERVAPIAGVPAAVIRDAAVTYARNRPGAVVEGMGVEQSPNAAQVLHARACLAALCGNYDVEGGDELPGPPKRFRTDREMELVELLSRDQRAKQVGHDRFRLHSMPGQELLTRTITSHYGKRGGMHWYTGEAHQPSIYRAILSDDPYPIKAGIFTSSNPLVSHANTRLVHAAMKKLELVVCCDLFWQPTAALADFVLPITSWLERPAIYNYVGFQLRVTGSAAALPRTTADYDRRTDFDFWRGLGVRLGQDAHWPWESLEASYDERLKETGRSFAELASSLGQAFPQEAQAFRKYERTGFATPTGKVELYSTVFERLGYSPLPYYEPHPDSEAAGPGLHRDYPLTVINGSRSNWYMLSDWRQVPQIRSHRPFPVLEVHPGTAQALGLAEGDWAWIENPLGRIIQRVTLSDGVKPDVVHADGQWWYPELGAAEPSLFGVWLSNINVILDDDPKRCSEILGTWPLKQTRGRVYKARGEDAGLVALLERLCLAGGQAMPAIEAEDWELLRRYSERAMAWPRVSESPDEPFAGGRSGREGADVAAAR